MILPTYIQQLLAERCGTALATAHDIDVLALDIECVTGEHLAVNTLKRLLGRLDDDREPRTTTLDILSHYLAFPNWDSLRHFAEHHSESAFDTVADELRTMLLQAGERVEVTYLPNRRLVLVCIGNGRFRVEVNENSKLHAGDELTIPILVAGYPLICHDVVHLGEKLGTYTGGRHNGISFNLLSSL